MAADIQGFLAERGLGPVEERVRLGGTLTTPAGEVRPELCLGPKGVWVVAAEGRFVGRLIDATDPALLRYEVGRLRDRLSVEGTPLTVPAGQTARVRRLIALGRLRRRAAAAAPSSTTGAGSAAASTPTPWTEDRYLDAVAQPARELARSLLASSDVLIAFLKLARVPAFASALGAEVPSETYLLLSADQVSVASLSELGDVSVQEISAPHFAQSLGTAHSDGGPGRAPLGTSRANLIAELAALVPLSPTERLEEAARRLYVQGRKAPPARIARLLDTAVLRGDARAALARAFMACETAGAAGARASVEVAVELASSSGLSESAAAEVWTRWTISAAAGRALVTLLSASGPHAESWAIALHRLVNGSVAPGDDSSAALELAEHELASGLPGRAREIAEAALSRAKYEDETVAAFDPADRPRAVRVRLYDVLRREALRRDSADFRALSALARMDPTNANRLEELARAEATAREDRALARRAGEVLACLAPGGLDGDTRPGDATLPEPLDRSVLLERVRHPLVRGSGPFAARISELLAATPEPDLGFLRDFCEELAETRHPDATRALGRTARLFGVSAVRAYVSRGARSVGIRAFGADEPFVLVGASHLSDEGPFVLGGAELDFALGSELAHLALGQQRVTTREVWTGAAGKTRDALLALGAALPLLAELGGARAARWLGRLGPDALGKVVQGAARLGDHFTGEQRGLDAGIGQRNEDLIAAHRLLQLSADRAGLVAAQDLRAALRAMLRLRSDYRDLLTRSTDRGLLPALGDPDLGTPALADVAVRVKALVAFYLSADFEALAVDAASTP